MLKKMLKMSCLTAVFCMSLGFAAFAAEKITDVRFTCGPDTEAALSEGITEPLFSSESDMYTLDYANDTNPDSTNYKTARTYELAFSAASGYEFPDASAITVTGTGITEITRKKIDNESVLIVRVKAYPYYMWTVPEFTNDDVDITEAKSIKINKNGAPTVEYLISYTDTYGEEKTKKGTVTSSSISVSSLNVKYKGSSEDRSDGYVNGIAIRATGKAGENTRTAPSNWNILGDIDVDSFEIETYETWGDILGAPKSSSESSGPSKSNTAANSSNNAKGPAYSQPSAAGSWVDAGNGQWYYKNPDGSKKTGWLSDGGYWYLLDSTGLMKTGWFQDTDGKWYYLNPVSDGHKGCMLTDWQQIDGKWYYFNPNDGGPKGSMVTGQISLNGRTYHFDASGACTDK